MIGCALVSSDRRYYAWQGLLLLLTAAGVAAYGQQWKHGFIVTHMTDQVCWGAYIANFTFLVGIAAAAILLVVPAYVYHRKDIKEVVLYGELIALSAIVMCLLFVTVDIGHPERVLHFMRMNFPSSILAWDVIVLTGYLILNLHIPGYLLWQRYRGREPSPWAYMPFVFISIFWAISIHTVTAFLYSGFTARPYWNTAILAPRFLVSAFASGPALLFIFFFLLDRFRMPVQDSIF